MTTAQSERHPKQIKGSLKRRNAGCNMKQVNKRSELMIGYTQLKNQTTHSKRQANWETPKAQ
jgi:hypothetical protein